VYRCCPRPYLSCRAWCGQGIHPSHRPPPLCAQLLALGVVAQKLRDHISALGVVAQKLRDHIICFGSGRAEIARPHICFASGRAEIARPHICFASGRAEVARPHISYIWSRNRSQNRCAFCATTPKADAFFVRSPKVALRAEPCSTFHGTSASGQWFGYVKNGTRLCTNESLVP